MNLILSLIRDFFAEFSRLKLFLLVFLSSLTAILLSLKFGGFAATQIVLAPAILSILEITKGVWTPEGGARSRVGLFGLILATAAAMTGVAWKPFVTSFTEPLLSKYPVLSHRLPKDAFSIIGLLFLGGIVIAVNYFSRDTTTMKEHPTPLETEFPEKQYKHLLKSFCGILRDDLNKIDRETNWSAEVFTPLDAEVEIRSRNKRLKRVTDLLRAIRSDHKSRVFLVLGDPGSGKSVALRKLCRDLLSEVNATGRIPLYVNLREWEPEKRWTEHSPPTVEALYRFVFKNLIDRGDVFTKDFLDKYFKKMFEDGRLFIVLDSFDEIPSVMDVNESSWLIESLSETIYRFLAGAHNSRGILASRIFRKPTSAFNARTVLEIRPFTEIKIADALRKSLFYEEKLLRILFNERREFIAIGRNPFTAALIASYAKGHGNTLPQTQAQLYSSYIQERLAACHEKIQARELDNQTIIECATDIADAMLTTETLGLEAPIHHLSSLLPRYAIEDVVDILKYARLGRVGSGDEKRFSFVHRRFNEYFVVQKLKRSPDTAPIDNIPTDSRWRDALVLFCETADEKRATEVADFCWSEIAKVPPATISPSDPYYVRAVHCLRFLNDAFRTRSTAIESFRSDLAKYIKDKLWKKGTLLSMKIAVESLGLLRADEIDDVLIKALSLNNSWINESALRSCHYLTVLSSDLAHKLRLFIDGMDSYTFIKKQRELMFSFSLSDAFRNIRRYCRLRAIDNFVVLASLVLSSIVAPQLVLFVIPFLVFVFTWRSSSIRSGREFSFASRYVMFILVAMGLLLVVFPPAGQPNRSTAIVVLMIVLTVVSFPWYQVWYYGPRVIHDAGLGLTDFVFLSIAIVAIFGIVGVFLFLFLNMAPRLQNWFAIAFSISLVILLAFLTAAYVTSFLADYRLTRGLSPHVFQTREQISNRFVSLKTERGRLRFVRFLDIQKINPRGVWPNGDLPNADYDEGSSRLAQLEERWLKLDR